MESIGKYTKPCVPPASYTAQPSGSDTSSRRGCRRAKSAAGSAASRRFCDGACPAEVEMAMDGPVYALCAPVCASAQPARHGRTTITAPKGTQGEGNVDADRCDGSERRGGGDDVRLLPAAERDGRSDEGQDLHRDACRDEGEIRHRHGRAHRDEGYGA